MVLMLSTGICAYAESPELVSTSVEYYPNGYYAVTEIYAVQTRAQQLTSGTSIRTLYDTLGDKVLSLEVHGTFKYNGSTCIATLASYDYTIYALGWSFVTADAYCEGNQAIADGEFKNPLLGTAYVRATLSCSPTGVLS